MPIVVLAIAKRSKGKAASVGATGPKRHNAPSSFCAFPAGGEFPEVMASRRLSSSPCQEARQRNAVNITFQPELNLKCRNRNARRRLEIRTNIRVDRQLLLGVYCFS
jgi:hypothetical protein